MKLGGICKLLDMVNGLLLIVSGWSDNVPFSPHPSCVIFLV